jgi:hypothetical protein
MYVCMYVCMKTPRHKRQQQGFVARGDTYIYVLLVRLTGAAIPLTHVLYVQCSQALCSLLQVATVIL